jgi:uncharacterized integral membrane protein
VRYLLFLLFLLACIGLTAITVLDISAQVHITIMTWRSPDAPLGFWMLAAFFLGAFLLYLISVASAVHDRREIRHLRRLVNDLQRSTSGPADANVEATVPQPQNDVLPVQAKRANGYVQGQQSAMGAVQLENRARYIPMPGIQPTWENLPPQNSGQ